MHSTVSCEQHYLLLVDSRAFRTLAILCVRLNAGKCSKGRRCKRVTHRLQKAFADEAKE